MRDSRGVRIAALAVALLVFAWAFPYTGRVLLDMPDTAETAGRWGVWWIALIFALVCVVWLIVSVVEYEPRIHRGGTVDG